MKKQREFGKNQLSDFLPTPFDSLRSFKPHFSSLNYTLSSKLITCSYTILKGARQAHWDNVITLVTKLMGGKNANRTRGST